MPLPIRYRERSRPTSSRRCAFVIIPTLHILFNFEQLVQVLAPPTGSFPINAVLEPAFVVHRCAFDTTYAICTENPPPRKMRFHFAHGTKTNMRRSHQHV